MTKTYEVQYRVSKAGDWFHYLTRSTKWRALAIRDRMRKNEGDNVRVVEVARKVVP